MDLNSFINQLLPRIDGAEAIALLDRDGNLVARVGSRHEEEEMGSIFSVTVDQASKLKLNKCNVITTFFKERICVQINVQPFIVVVSGNNDLNVGLVSSMREELIDLLKPCAV